MTKRWSPDSRFIGFVSGDMIRKIEVAGGQPTTICDRKLRTGALGVGSWGTTGTILLDDIEIWAISSSGGQPVQAAWPDRSRGEGGCGWPEFLPDGNHFLYLAGIEGKPDSTALRLGRLNSKESKILAVGDFSRVEYVPPGYVLYLRGRTLLARPFDAERLRMTGDAIPVVDDVLRADTAGFAEFSASATGTLVYSDDYTWEGKKRLVWLDRKGREIGTLGPPGHYWATIAQSPDKKRVAVSFTAPGEFNPDIWMLDIVRNVATRFTSDPGGEFWPVWSPDGATVYFYAMRLGTYRVWMKPASGIGEERELPMPPGDAAPQAVTPDFMYPDREDAAK